MLEQASLYLFLVGLGLILAGYLWFVVRAFKTRWFWGLATLIPPFFLLFLCFHFRKARLPALVSLVGVGCIAGVTYTNRHDWFVDLGPREEMVDGEQHITLTGWDRSSYKFLLFKRDVVVLQMANEDVTDETLGYLRGLSKLRELDLRHTQITDASLSILKELPALQDLRLEGTKITDTGFREHLADKESLERIDLRDTSVNRETVKAWRDAKPGRKALR